MLVLAFALAAIAEPDHQLDPEGTYRLRLVTGSEWDTNARRAVDTTISIDPGASRPREVVGDALVRVLLESEGHLALTASDNLNLRYLLGAKRFFREEGEDLLTHDLSLSTAHRILDELSFSPDARLRASRMRNESRDYTVFSAGGAIIVDILDELSLTAFGRADSYAFAYEDLDSIGPTAGAELGWKVSERMSLALFVENAWRNYSGPVRTEVLESGVRRIYEVCSDGTNAARCAAPSRRRDTELFTGARAIYRGSVLVGGELSVRLNRSNSEFEEIDRYGISVFATIPLPYELRLSISGGLQLSHGISATQSKYLVEDDENQNRIEAQLSRHLVGDLSADVRYALYANEFLTSETNFLRQTFYLGLSYELEGGGSN